MSAPFYYPLATPRGVIPVGYGYAPIFVEDGMAIPTLSPDDWARQSVEAIADHVPAECETCRAVLAEFEVEGTE